MTIDNTSLQSETCTMYYSYVYIYIYIFIYLCIYLLVFSMHIIYLMYMPSNQSSQCASVETQRSAKRALWGMPGVVAKGGSGYDDCTRRVYAAAIWAK